MTATAQFWALTVVLAAGTWAMRSLPIMLHGHVPHPTWLSRLLKYVPVAALTALVVPGALYLRQGAVYELSPGRTLAAMVAMAVAVRTRNVLLTLVSGMVTLWLVQWMLTL